MGSTFPRNETDHEVPWLRESVKRLAARGHKVIFIAPAYLGLKDHQIDGVPVRRFRYAPAGLEMLTHGEGAPNKLKKNPILKLLTLSYLFAGAHTVWKICRRERIDILHVHWPFPHGLMALLPAWSPGSKVVYSCHSAEFALAAGSKISTAILAFCLRRSAAITANSTHTARLVEAVSGRRARIIPWGATVKLIEREQVGSSENTSVATGPATTNGSENGSTNHQSPNTSQLLSLTHQHSEPPLLLFSGRLIERKGVNYLLHAIPLILQKRNVRLVITGDGHYRQEWESLARELGVAGSVRFAGFVSNEELSSLFRSCTVYVHPAIYDSRGDTEGQGVVLVEALSNRKPVVASNVGGILDLVKDGETGLLVPEKNPEAIAEAVLRLLNNPEYARHLGEQGYAHVQKYFDWGLIMEQYEALYQKCVSPDARPVIEEAEPVTS